MLTEVQQNQQGREPGRTRIKTCHSVIIAVVYFTVATGTACTLRGERFMLLVSYDNNNCKSRLCLVCLNWTLSSYNQELLETDGTVGRPWSRECCVDMDFVFSCM